MAEAKTEPIATRHAYGDALVELGEAHEDVVALDADLAVSTQSMKFGKAFPERFFNVGAAEANMMSMACGLAATGKVPYCSTFAIFASGRAYDQVRLGIAHNELKVRIGASHGGVSLGEDGASHQMIEDIALMRAMPRMQVVVPADYNQAYRAVDRVLREGRADVHALRPPLDPDRLRRDPRDRSATGVDVLREGKDISIIACGHMVWRALEAAEALEREDGVEAEVLNVVDRQAARHRDDPRVARQDRRRGDRRGAPRRRRARRRGAPGRRRAAPGPGLRRRDARRVRRSRDRRGLHGALRPHRARHRRPRPRGARAQADRLAPAASRSRVDLSLTRVTQPRLHGGTHATAPEPPAAPARRLRYSARPRSVPRSWLSAMRPGGAAGTGEAPQKRPPRWHCSEHANRGRSRTRESHAPARSARDEHARRAAPQPPIVELARRDASSTRAATSALERVSLHVERGEFMFLVGPTGCGKSTLIKLLIREVELAERRAADRRPRRRLAARPTASRTCAAASGPCSRTSSCCRTAPCLRQRRLRAPGDRRVALGDPPQGPRDPAPRRPRRQDAQLPGRAVRRRAAAGLGRARVRQPPAAAARRRADRKPRPR